MDSNHRTNVELILAQANALRDALRFIYNTDIENIWRFGSFRTFMMQYNELAQEFAGISPVARKSLKLFSLEKVKGQFDTLAMEQKSYCDSTLALLSILISVAEGELGARASELGNMINFLQSRLRPAVIREPERERDIQDVIEQLLIGRGLTKGVDYDREVGRVKVSSKEVIPDFILPKLALAVEVKLLRDAAKRSALIDEINADIQAYGKEYAYLVFVVYDLGGIRDEIEFKQDLHNDRNVFVVVVKH